MVSNLAKNLNLNVAKLSEMEVQTAEAVQFGDVDFAKNFVRHQWPQFNADRDLVNSRPELYQRLERLFYLNLILIIPALSEKQIIELFSKGIIFYFKEMTENFDLWQSIRGNLLTVMHENRDALKEKIRKALLDNEELITAKKIIRNEKDYPPKIKEWLIDYTSVVGTGKVDSFKVNQYFSQSQNFRNLSPEDQIKIRILIETYEKLKRSTFEPEGLEEKVDFVVDGQHFVFNEGRIENLGEENILPPTMEIDQKQEPLVGAETENIASPVGLTDNSEVEKEVQTAYHGDLGQQKKIAKEQSKLEKKFKDNLPKLREEFFKTVQKMDDIKTVAILRVLTQAGDLEKFLEQDSKLNKFLKAIWAKRYGQEFAQEFSENPAQLKFVRLFLRYVLEERLELAESDAARIGLQIGNIFVSLGQKGYNKMAYFDVNKKEFVWFE